MLIPNGIFLISSSENIFKIITNIKYTIIDTNSVNIIHNLAENIPVNSLYVNIIHTDIIVVAKNGLKKILNSKL